MPLRKLNILLFFLLLGSAANAQKVGLVLSGGGALGYSHIGVLKALEENGIPIDYITGTSAGAMVGGMYASGWSPEVMDSLVTDKKFQLMSFGGIEKKFDYFFRKTPDDASWVNFKINKRFELSKIIPTNFNNSVLLDFESMTAFSGISARVNYNFDSLFVPFRCVASDIENKKEVVFKDGHLNQAVRASMTYPGYLKPLKVNGSLMFDGGLYNNFPTDVMYDEFFPDIIIGVNFTDTTSPPQEDDVISQLKSMVIDRRPSTIICENGILIEPDQPIGVFGFDEADKAIEAGYNATIAVMDEIKSLIQRRVSKMEVNQQRKVFHSKVRSVNFESVEVEGVNKKQGEYIKKALMHKDAVIDIETLKKRYFWLVTDEKMKFIYPVATLNQETGNYKLLLQAYPEKPFSLKFGGVFSSKPINTGYVGVKYSRFGKIGMRAEGASYFGKFYGSTRVATVFDFNYKVPFSIKLEALTSRWDYFRSFTTFFEESRPSFIVENERFAGVTLTTPIGRIGKLDFGYDYGFIENRYYQNDGFTPTDTSDVSSLLGSVYHIDYLQSTLNRKQYASEGGQISFKIKYFNGFETTRPGSTSFLTIPSIEVPQEMLSFRLKMMQYIKLNTNFSIGLNLDASALTTEEFLDNYTATIIASPNFQPTPESRTFLLSKYSTHYFASVGGELIYAFLDNVELRGALYFFQPIYTIKPNSFNQPSYDLTNVDPISIVSSGSLVYHSPVGPLSASVNYYGLREKPLSLLVTFGYIIHNRRFLK